MRRIARVAAVSVLVVLGLLLAGPQKVGGPIAAVSTYGESMLPTYQPHHLVVVLRDTSYEVGDIVAYRSETLDTVVLHRIVDVDGAGFVTRGDNNDWLDPDRPNVDEMLGRAVLAVPGVGRLLELPTPVRVAVPFLIAGGSILVSPTDRHRSVRRGRRASRETRSPTRVINYGMSAGSPRQLLVTGLLVGTVAGAVALFGFTQPPRVEGPVTYEQQARFSYEAGVPASAAYPDGHLESGDPIFLQLVDRVTVNLRWTFASDAPSEVRGGGRLVARVTDGSGWETTIPLGREQMWTGPEATLSGVLDFAAVRAMADQVTEATGVSGGTRTIEVIADLDVDGHVAGVAVARGFEPAVTFRVDELRAVVATAGGAEAAEQIPVGTDSGAVVAPGAEPNTVAFAGRELSLGLLRAASVVGIAAGVMLCMAGLLAGWRRRDWDEHQRIADRHGDVLVEVAALSEAGDRSLVRVSTMDALAELARQRDLPVLKVPIRGGGHGYVVEDMTARYRYLVREPVAVSSRTQPSRSAPGAPRFGATTGSSVSGEPGS